MRSNSFSQGTINGGPAKLNGPRVFWVLHGWHCACSYCLIGHR